jgi:hypothetical protein
MTTTTTTLGGAELAAGCPRPPSLIRVAATNLMLARTGTKEQKARLRPFEALPRPWIPSSCHASLLEVLLPWLDKVAAWLNHDYSWLLRRPIPECWPAHPHILHELAGLAWLRVVADQALDPGPLEDWHRYALPSFTTRLAERLGDNCSTGHERWPGAARQARYWDPESRAARAAVFDDLVQRQLRVRPEQQQLHIDDGELPPDGDLPDDLDQPA